MTKTYDTEHEALRRAHMLMRRIGVWPGVIRCANGYRLTYDPEVYPYAHDEDE